MNLVEMQIEEPLPMSYITSSTRQSCYKINEPTTFFMEK